MKLTNRQILNSVESLQALLQVKLPVKTSFEVAKISRLLDDILRDYQKTAQRLKFEFSDEDVDHPDFAKAIEELLECKTEVSCEKISLESLGEVNLEPAVFYHLNWLIEE
jgi:hypothetical protein